MSVLPRQCHHRTRKEPAVNPILITFGEKFGASGYHIEYEGKHCYGLSFDEMLAQVVAITYPTARGRQPETIYRFYYLWEIRDEQRRYGTYKGEPLLLLERCA